MLFLRSVGTQASKLGVFCYLVTLSLCYFGKLPCYLAFYDCVEEEFKVHGGFLAHRVSHDNGTALGRRFEVEGIVARLVHRTILEGIALLQVGDGGIEEDGIGGGFRYHP